VGIDKVMHVLGDGPLAGEKSLAKMLEVSQILITTGCTFVLPQIGQINEVDCYSVQIRFYFGRTILIEQTL
jgi:hypothetical protein